MSITLAYSEADIVSSYLEIGTKSLLSCRSTFLILLP